MQTKLLGLDFGFITRMCCPPDSSYAWARSTLGIGIDLSKEGKLRGLLSGDLDSHMSGSSAIINSAIERGVTSPQRGD
jgi:hypothetical protein